MDKRRDIDDILSARAAPPPMRSNLEYRIVEAARQSAARRNQDKPRRSLLDAFLDSVLLPRPAFSMAAVLVFGLMIGLYMPSDSATSSAASLSTEYAYFLSADDGAESASELGGYLL